MNFHIHVIIFVGAVMHNLKTKKIFIVVFLLSVSFLYGKSKEIKKITWTEITSYEYLGQDTENFYLLDLYEDFVDAKIDEKKILKTTKSSFSSSEILEYFKNAECTVGKLQIESDKKEETTLMILFLKDKELYEVYFKED